MESVTILMNCRLTIVIEKPIQFTMVSDVPRDSGYALCATRVENKGESAITTNPQKNKNAIRSVEDGVNRNSGEVRQQRQDSNKAMVAIRLAPNRCENTPLITHAIPPEAIIRKDNKETFRFISG